MKKLLVLPVVALALGACGYTQQERATSGALIGGGTGAVVGGVASNSVGGAVAGGIVGAAGGAIVGAATSPEARRGSRGGGYFVGRDGRCYYQYANGRTVRSNRC